MKIDRIDNWQSLTETQSTAGCWAGVAIGPESQEAFVRVNGVLLQAGRVLPLAVNGSYKIERVIGVRSSISRLQLILFEHRDELAVNVARPSARQRLIYTGTGALAEVLQVPTAGRRATLFVLSTATLTRYKVVGRVTFLIPGEFQEIVLKDVTMAAGSSVAFYIGGTNESENWHELGLSVDVAAAGSCNVYAETYGEIG